MSDASIYDEDYFMHGRETGKSLYDNYRWMPELTIPMVGAIIQHLGIKRKDTILDFGCARGYIVKALRLLGYEAYGYDTSKWAIDNCHPDVKQYVSNEPHHSEPARMMEVDWVIAKDVMEHVSLAPYVIPELMSTTRKGMFVVVPLSSYNGSDYVIKEYEKDITHIHRLTLLSWARMFHDVEWSVELRYRLPGVKDNYWKPGCELGNGFITCKRIVE